MPLYGTIVIIKRTGLDGSRYPVTTKRTLIGSAENCDLRIRLPTVALEHCEINVTEDKEVVLVNLDGNEPATVDGQELPVGEPRKLTNGNVFTITDRSFRFEATALRRRSTRTSTAVVEKPPAVPTTPAAVKSQNGSGLSTGQKDRSKTPKRKAETPSLWPSQKKENWSSTKKPPPTKIPKLSATTFRKVPDVGSPKVQAVQRLLRPDKDMNSPTLGGVSQLFQGDKAAESSKEKPLILFTPVSVKGQNESGLSTDRSKTPKRNAETPRLATSQKKVNQSSSKKPAPTKIPNFAATKLKKDKVIGTPKVTAIRRLLREEKVIDSPKLSGVTHLFRGKKEMQTPAMDGVRRLLMEEKNVNSPKIGITQLFREEKAMDSPKVGAIRRLLQKEKDPSSPIVGGVSRMFREGKEMESPRLNGVGRLFEEEKEASSPKLAGMTELFREEHETQSPKLNGIGRLFHEEKNAASPKLGGVSQLFRGEKDMASPKVGAVRRLYQEEKNADSPKFDGFSQLFQFETDTKSAKRRGGRREKKNTTTASIPELAATQGDESKSDAAETNQHTGGRYRLRHKATESPKRSVARRGGGRRREKNVVEASGPVRAAAPDEGDESKPEVAEKNRRGRGRCASPQEETASPKRNGVTRRGRPRVEKNALPTPAAAQDDQPKSDAVGRSVEETEPSKRNAAGQRGRPRRDKDATNATSQDQAAAQDDQSKSDVAESSRPATGRYALRQRVKAPERLEVKKK